ncbi:MAG: hypothetical protein AAGC70_00030 [Pseudomonadota bacterium]
MLRKLASSMLAAIAIALISGPAMAQTGISPFPLKPKSKTASKLLGGGVSISVSYQFFMEGNPRSIEEQAVLSEKGRRAVYTLLAKECAALLETIASSCKISRANVSSQMNTSTSRYQARGVRVSGSATYRISLKPLSKAAPNSATGTPQ